METWHLCQILLLTVILMFGNSAAQTNPCESQAADTNGGTPTIIVGLQEVSLGDLTQNPDAYIADTKINGILGGTSSLTGITLEISASVGTPSGIDVTQLFSLESRSIPPENGFSQRAFIRLVEPLDRDGTTATTFDDLDVIEFQIKCQQVGSTTSTFFLMTVDVQDINDNSPVFTNTPYLTNVNELSPVGTTVYKDIAASDNDAGVNKNIDFAIVAGNADIRDGSQKFNILTPRLGYVVIQSPHDFEELSAIGQTYYILNISATDQATAVSDRKTTYTQLRIDITDGDDLPPIFEVENCVRVENICFHPTYTTEVTSNAIGGILTLRPENSPSLTAVFDAQDQDTLNASIIFTVEQTIPPGYQNRFTISGTGSTGKRYTASLSQVAAINRNNLQELEIIIKAAEQTTERRSSRAVVKTTVIQANNNDPVVTVPFTGYINENSPIGSAPTNSDGSSLLRVTVTDGDLAPGEVGQYDLTIEGTSDFTVTTDGYIILNTNTLNYEATPSFTFTVRATEVGTASPRNGATNVIVIVRDLNDNPPVFTSTSYAVSTAEQDYSTSPKLLVTVVANDLDSNANGDIKFSIVNVTSGGMGKFYISKTSGATNPQTAAVSINGSVIEGEIYVIIVKAEDSATTDKRSTTITVQVDITGTGTRPPVIPASVYTLSISEGTPIGTSIFTIPATDPEGSALVYAITGGNNGDFTINTNTGVITTVRGLNREAEPSYNLGLRVTDNTQLTDTATLSITVTDINDITPAFTTNIYNFTVDEGKNPGTPVDTVTATDGDSGVNGQFLYSIASVSPTGSSNLFTINGNSGLISTVQRLDYEAKNLHTIVVLAKDQGTSPRTGSSTVNIRVKDLQDEIPLFTSENYERSVAENSGVGTEVLQVTAIDPDTVDAITYKFSTGNSASFSIASDGRITTNAILDYETIPQYIFTVTTQEGENGGVSSTATVTVNVLATEQTTKRCEAVVNTTPIQAANNSDPVVKVLFFRKHCYFCLFLLYIISVLKY